MSINVKKIIVREGLILLVLIALFYGSILFGGGPSGALALIVIPGSMICYPLYLVVRFIQFIIWAIKTLQERRVK